VPLLRRPAGCRVIASPFPSRHADASHPPAPPPLVTPSHLALPLLCLTRAGTEETETNIAVDGNGRDDAKKGGGRSIVVALAVSDSTIPPPPPPPTADIVVLALVVPLRWGRRRRPRGIAPASESNIISSCVTEVSAGIFDRLKWFRSDFFYYVSLQRTCYIWEFRFLYEKGRISCFSYPGVRYYSTLPRSFARRHAKKASSYPPTVLIILPKKVECT
jgi:hypothetical protein